MREIFLDTFQLYSYDRLDSTNTQAERLLPLDRPSIIWALEQEQGRGRQGRNWYSPPGNLYATFVFPLVQKLPLSYPLLSLAASVAVGLALTELTQSISYPPLIQLKWPNDVLLNDHKGAGLLLETITNANTPYPTILIGIGVNVVSHPSVTSEMIYPPTSLKGEGIKDISVFQVLDKTQKFLWQWYHHWLKGQGGLICSTWQNHAAFLDKPIEVRYKTPSLKGIFKGINQDGHMLLQTPDGQSHTIMIGDVLRS